MGREQGVVAAQADGWFRLRQFRSSPEHIHNVDVTFLAPAPANKWRRLSMPGLAMKRKGYNMLLGEIGSLATSQATSVAIYVAIYLAMSLAVAIS